MPGFLRAVIDAYQHIALGTLQGNLQAWRPLDYVFSEGCAVIKADLAAAGSAGSGFSFSWAVGVPIREDRLDVITWLDAGNGSSGTSGNHDITAQLEPIKATRPDAFLIPAVTVAKTLALEYCKTWPGLLDRLREQGVDRRRVLEHLARAAAINQASSDVREHGVVLFRVSAYTGSAETGHETRFAVTRLTQHDVGVLADYYAANGDGDAADAPILVTAPRVKASWIRVYDARPEAIQSRTAERPTEKLAGATILLLGCGGLGAPIAEHCVRSGAARVHIIDRGTVNPGILSRQPYEDADIGKPKVEVLAARLNRVRPENKVTASNSEITWEDIFRPSSLEDYDMIIDTTASRSVAAKLERSQRDEHARWPTLITVAINQRATHGVAAVTPRGAVGAGIDLLRRLGLTTCTSTALGDVYEAFFPPEGDQLNFRPDTGCSDTTFIGSATDISALAAQLLDSALARLKTPVSATDTHRSLSIIRLGRDDGLRAARVVLDLPPDHVVMDQGRSMYEVRVDKAALETIQEYIRASANGRIPGSSHTGGLLLGQFDSTSRIAWVSEATGLPRGSSASPLKISLDVRKVRDFLEDRSSRTGGMLTLIGFWHAHPGGSAAPSDEDRATMRELVAGPEWPATPALLLIAGVRQGGSVGDPESLWAPEIHAETFTNES
jgi:proteasome lid subunit RPN8/RPN11